MLINSVSLCSIEIEAEKGHAHPKPYRLGAGLKTVCKIEEKESAHQIADTVTLGTAI